MKTIKKEFGEHIITAKRLPQTTANIETFKLAKVIMPSASVLINDGIEADKVYVQVFSLLSHHSTAEHFTHLQTLLFSTLLDDELNPVTNVESFLESKQVNALDLLFWLFSAQIGEHFINSVAFKTLAPMLDSIKQSIGFSEEKQEDKEDDTTQ